MSEKTFEGALEDLGNIVESMESGDLTLDESLKNYETGIKLSRFCKNRLDQAEKKVEVLVKKTDGSVSTEEFGERYPSEDRKQEDKNVTVNKAKKEIEPAKEIEVKEEIKPEKDNVTEEKKTVEAETTVITDASDDNNRNTAVNIDKSECNPDIKEEFISTFEEDLLF